MPHAFASELSNDELQTASECLPHSDYDYKRLLIGQWRFEDLLVHKNNQYYTNIEFGTTGTVKMTMFDINNFSQIFNEAYGYYDVKNSNIIITFYNETRSEIGLANNEAYVFSLNCACPNKAIVNFRSFEYVMGRV